LNSVRTYYGSKIITEESVRKEISLLWQKGIKVEENKPKLILNVNDKKSDSRIIKSKAIGKEIILKENILKTLK
jgi:hypothetical protein